MRSKVKICLCPKSISWIIHHLKKSSISTFRRMIGETKRGRFKVKKRRTAKQRAATRRLIAFNKRRRR